MYRNTYFNEGYLKNWVRLILHIGPVEMEKKKQKKHDIFNMFAGIIHVGHPMYEKNFSFRLVIVNSESGPSIRIL